MTKDDDIFKFDLELSDKEIHLIGQIITHWGALENEIFTQTLLTFDDQDEENISLPKEMNNLQFTGVLDLWKELVVDKADSDKSKVLQQQLDEINNLKEYRDALIHGMLEWSTTDLDRITSNRIKKKEIISVHFTADDLYNFYCRLAGINFKIRYPGGTSDYANQLAEQGSYISRSFLNMVTDTNGKTED